MLTGLNEITKDFNQESVKFKTAIWRSADKLSKRIARKMKFDSQSMQQGGTDLGTENSHLQNLSSKGSEEVFVQLGVYRSGNAQGETIPPVIKSSPVMRTPLKKEVRPAKTR